ncbi:TetR/AcrR family transcriptional regulator [Actinomadura spongiicola]|uniref:TetR/AcrR family transcriptional regulator n=1 Tax=Actinomadura spongiicola TaxID=2303421 RepID=A0A372GKD2_9ACTN|nr:TetR/AcrR family transcriptional regulator [Actinomadura spongiicola]RFS85830.1 TetR/AcrR family transcriptional regulator [Actinomadura spongiicola]
MKREALLDAAETVLFEQGTRALTLTAVAEQAGVSKGGLLYHFPTKEALVRAMVARTIDEFDDLVASYIDSYGDGTPDAYTRAYVDATFELLTGDARTHRRWSAITAAAADPEQAAPLNEAMRRWHGRDPAEDTDPCTAMTVRLAVEGLWEVMSHDPGLFDEEQLAALRRRLLGLLDG